MVLAYFKKEDSAFCKLCAGYSKSVNEINHQKLSTLILNGFDNWKYAIETFYNRALLNYYLKWVIDINNFLKIKNKQTLPIAS